MKVLTKGKAEEKTNDRFGHIIFPGEYYIKGLYLQKTRSKLINKRKFTILHFVVYVTPDEIFDHFLEIDEDLCMDADVYTELVERASLQM